MESLKDKEYLSHRNPNIDLIKIISMFGVVAIHSTAYWMTIDNVLGIILYRLSVTAIPVFFMVSGYLLLGRSTDSFKYSIRKILLIIRYVAFCSIVVYGIILSYGYYKSGELCGITELCYIFLGSLVQSGPLQMFWYLGAMIIIYLLLPIINRIFTAQSKKYQLIWLGVLLYIELSVMVITLTKGAKYELSVWQSFRQWNWLLYFSLGGTIKCLSALLSNIKFRLWHVVALATALIILEETFMSNTGTNLGEVFDSAFFVIAFCAVWFCYCLQLHVRCIGFVRILSPLFLPVYTLHPYVMKWMSNFYDFYTCPLYTAPLLHFLAVSVATVILSMLLMKIPFIAKITKI